MSGGRACTRSPHGSRPDHVPGPEPVTCPPGGATMPLDPQIKALLDQIAALNPPPLWEMSAVDARNSFRTMTTMAGKGEAVTSVEDRSIDGPAGAIPVRVYRPSEQRPLPVLVF